MEIVELNDIEISYLVAICNQALKNGQTVKLTTSGYGLKVKRGESVWTPSFGTKNSN